MNNHKKICESIKSKNNPNIQCQNKRKLDSDFCGKHQISSIYFIKKETINDIIIQDNNELIHETNDIMIQYKSHLFFYPHQRACFQ